MEKKQISLGRGWQRHGLLLAVLCSILLFQPTYVCSQELIVNGGFETGDFTGWTLNFTPPNNAAAITTTPDRVYHGSYAVNFSFNEVPAMAILSQTFNTVSGAKYNIGFAFGTVAWNDRYATLHFDVLGVNGTTVLDSFTLTRIGNNPAGGGQVNPAEWSLEQGSFTADGASATFRVTDLTSQTSACDALFDYLSIQQQKPIPSLSLLGIIILMFLLFIVAITYVRRVQLCTHTAF